MELVLVVGEASLSALPDHACEATHRQQEHGAGSSLRCPEILLPTDHYEQFEHWSRRV